ncbi:MAG: hypothetical protein GY751_16220 [Bacteroidetes bacterium]|nr:hypothetical protein [Bacteroidota bacterium]
MQHANPDNVQIGTVNSYKYNSKEKIDDFGLGWYDYGWRMYDPIIGRWHVIDNYAEKFMPVTPYSYVANLPMIAVDPDGQDINLFQSNEKEKDDDMFMYAALTRALDIMNSDDFGDDDIVVLRPFEDLSEIEGITNDVVGEYSEEFGETAELGVFSHASFDGPIGTEETSSNSLDGYQMNLQGWESIDFNFKDEGASACFYGCRTGRTPGGEGEQSFAQMTSQLDNFKNVSVWGQSHFSGPSTSPTTKHPSRQFQKGNFSVPVYMVVDGVTLLDRFMSFKAKPMNGYKNGESLGTRFQPQN